MSSPVCLMQSGHLGKCTSSESSHTEHACVLAPSLGPSSAGQSLSPVASHFLPAWSSWKAYVDGGQATTLIVLKPVLKIRSWLWLRGVAAAACCKLGCVWHCCPWHTRSVGKQIYQHLQAGKSPLLVCESQKGMQYTVVLNCLCSLYYNKLWGNNYFPEVISTALTAWEIWSACFLVWATAHEITTIKRRAWMKDPFSSIYTAIFGSS